MPDWASSEGLHISDGTKAPDGDGRSCSWNTRVGQADRAGRQRAKLPLIRLKVRPVDGTHVWLGHRFDFGFATFNDAYTRVARIPLIQMFTGVIKEGHLEGGAEMVGSRTD